ncbi:MAG: hypothetical protein Q9170_002440 [Blastenia crenularia]
MWPPSPPPGPSPQITRKPATHFVPEDVIQTPDPVESPWVAYHSQVAAQPIAPKGDQPKLSKALQLTPTPAGRVTRGKPATPVTPVAPVYSISSNTPSSIDTEVDRDDWAKLVQVHPPEVLWTRWPNFLDLF